MNKEEAAAKHIEAREAARQAKQRDRICKQLQGFKGELKC
jgi:hypothetical protein